MTIQKWPERSVRTDCEYGYEWAPMLEAGETITARDVLTDYPLDIYREYITGTVQTIWVRGGEPSSAQIVLLIETNRGRTFDQTFRLDTTG